MECAGRAKRRRRYRPRTLRNTAGAPRVSARCNSPARPCRHRFHSGVALRFPPHSTTDSALLRAFVDFPPAACAAPASRTRIERPLGSAPAERSVDGAIDPGRCETPPVHRPRWRARFHSSPIYVCVAGKSAAVRRLQAAGILTPGSRLIGARVEPRPPGRNADCAASINQTSHPKAERDPFADSNSSTSARAKGHEVPVSANRCDRSTAEGQSLVSESTTREGFPPVFLIQHPNRSSSGEVSERIVHP